MLHFIPIRVLLMMWGIIKFSKRIIKPHAVTNNEVLDLLSRIPDDEELVSLSRFMLNVLFFINAFHFDRFNSASFHSNSQPTPPAVTHGRKRHHRRIRFA